MDDARIHRAMKQQLATDAMFGVDQLPWAEPTGEIAEWLTATAPGTPGTPGRGQGEDMGGTPSASTQTSTSSGAPSGPSGGWTHPGVAAGQVGGGASAGPKIPAYEKAPPIPLPDGTKAEKLAALKDHLLANQALQARCPEGTQLVFGEGDPEAAIMFVGEGPGQVEAEQGRPFVGPASELLTKMIVAMGLSRETVYITNMVNFRPPNNRVPTPDEMGLCDPYLIGQIETVRPKVLVCLGGTATKGMLETNTGITRMRGTWVPYDRVDPPIELMPTFHPAFLLRSYTKENRTKVWADLQQVMQKVGLG